MTRVPVRRWLGEVAVPGGGQLALLRALLGLHLAALFAGQLPWAAELYGPAGVLPDPGVLPWVVFPDVLRLLDGPLVAPAFLVGATALALAFTAGLLRPLAALGLWFALATLSARNFFTFNLSNNYLGWLLLAFALIPGREPWSLDRRLRGAPDDWAVPRTLVVGTWAVVALSYSVSGLSKLALAEWTQGVAVQGLLASAIARPAAAWVLALPTPALVAASWAVLVLELGHAPLCLRPRGRALAWTGMVAVHLGIAATTTLTPLSLGVLLFHGFLFDPGWLPGRLRARPAAAPP